MRHGTLWRGLAALLLGILLAPALSAATFVVGNTNDAGAGSLRQAIIDANGQAGFHTIDARNTGGVIQLGIGLPHIGGHVTIKGPGKAVPLINRVGFAPTGTVTDTIFHVTAGATLALEGVNITHPQLLEWAVLTIYAGAAAELTDCHFEGTGGITCFGRMVTRDCLFKRNSGWQCGAVQLNFSGEMLCQRTRFEAHTPLSIPGMLVWGGALTLLSGQATLEYCTFLQNEGPYGGAIFCQSTLFVRDCTFQGNKCLVPGYGRGGAICVSGLKASTQFQVGIVECERTFFSSNQAGQGGAIGCRSNYLVPSTGASYEGMVITLRSCSFVENSAVIGGALYLAEVAASKLYNCTFSGNSATGTGIGPGGAIYVDTAYNVGLDIAHCTMRANSSASGSGGLYLWVPTATTSSAFRIQNTVIAGNTGTDFGSSHAPPAGISGGFNFIGTAGATGFPALPTDMVGTAAAPLDPLLSGLSTSGSSLPAFFPLAGSPLLDAAAYFHAIATDQRGAPRPADLPAVTNAARGDGSDIGAAEVQVAPLITASQPFVELTLAPGTASSRPTRVDVSGFALTSWIAVTATAPFEIAAAENGPYMQVLTSGAPDGFGGVGPMAVWVRYSPAGGTAHSGTLQLASPGTALSVPLSGFVLPSQPGAIQLSNAMLTFSSTAWVNPTPSQSYAVSGNNLVLPITLTAPKPFELSFDGVSGWTGRLRTVPPSQGLVPPTTVFVRYRPLQGHHHICLVGHSSPGAPTVNVNLSGSTIPLGPLTASASVLHFSTTGVNVPSAEQSYVISGVGLGSNVILYAPENFQFSLSSGGGFTFQTVYLPPTPTGGLAPTTIYVRYNPRGGVAHAEEMANGGANFRVVVHVIGLIVPATTALPPTIQLAPLPAAGFMYLEAPALNTSDIESYTLSGTSLNGAVDLATAAPFEISFNPGGPWSAALVSPAPVGGQLAAVTIWVRYSPVTSYAEDGEVLHSSPGAPPARMILPGRVANLPGLVSTSSTGNAFFANGLNPTPDWSYTVSGTGLTQPITLTMFGPYYQMSFTAGSGYSTTTLVTAAPIGGVIPPTTVYVRYVPTSTVYYGGSLQHASFGAASKTLSFSGQVILPPGVTASTAAMSFTTTALAEPSDEQSYVVSATGLTSPLTVSVTPPFEISLTMGVGFGSHILRLSQYNLTGVVIYVRYRPTSGMSHVGTISNSSAGTPGAQINLTGGVVPPGPLIATTASLSFSTLAVNMASAPQSFNVSGTFLAGSVALGVEGPFEAAWSASGPWVHALMTPPPVSGTVGPLAVYVRYLPQTPGTHVGAARLISPGAATIVVPLDGFVVPPPTIVVSAGNLAFPFLGRDRLRPNRATQYQATT